MFQKKQPRVRPKQKVQFWDTEAGTRGSRKVIGAIHIRKTQKPGGKEGEKMPPIC
jgi:hypothetical protein